MTSCTPDAQCFCNDTSLECKEDSKLTVDVTPVARNLLSEFIAVANNIDSSESVSAVVDGSESVSAVVDSEDDASETEEEKEENSADECLALMPDELTAIIDDDSCERALKFFFAIKEMDEMHINPKLKSLISNDFINLAFDCMKDTKDISYDSLANLLHRLNKLKQTSLSALAVNIVGYLLSLFDRENIIAQLADDGKDYYGLEFSDDEADVEDQHVNESDVDDEEDDEDVSSISDAMQKFVESISVSTITDQT